MFRRKEYHDNLADLHNYDVNVYTREIHLNSLLSSREDEEMGVDYSMALRFIKNIKFLENQNLDPIIIRQCTVGGDWNYGMAIYDAIKSCRCNTTIVCYAHARSMSSIIPQAANRRIIMPNCDFMVHYGTISLNEISQAAKTSIDQNELASKRMLNIYAERCLHSNFFNDYSLKEIVEFIDKQIRNHVDWYLTPEKACELGFMDAIGK